MTTIINYNLGNPKSIKNMLAYLGIESIISADHEDIASAERLILPGVGHFQHGMEQLEQLGLLDVLNKEVLENKKPILGICLGMQLLTKHSEEGNLAGLGFIDAQTKKFEFQDATYILCTTQYGQEFVSGFQHQNIFGLQFHPEKSHKFGMELLANFCKI